jgi:hypothetical protein
MAANLGRRATGRISGITSPLPGATSDAGGTGGSTDATRAGEAQDAVDDG